MTDTPRHRNWSSRISLLALAAVCAGALLFSHLRQEMAVRAGEPAPASNAAPVAAVTHSPPSSNTLSLVKQLHSEPEYARIARLLALRLPRLHLLHEPCDDHIATNALYLYLTSLDADHTFFLAEDIARFQTMATELDNKLADGDIQPAYEIFELFKERVRNRVLFVDQFLERSIDLNTDATYQWKRRNTPWPADNAAWDAIWAKKVVNEYLAQVVARTLAAEEKNSVTNKPAASPAATNGNGRARRNGDTQNAALTPEQVIRKRYDRFYTVLNDSDAEWVLQRYLTSFAQAYDPHSEYMSATSAEDFDIGMKLSLGGIGAVLSSEDGAAKIERNIPGGPADRDGRLKPGDKIIAVGQGDAEAVDVLHWPLYRTVRLIRGPKGTRVTLIVIPATDVTGGLTTRIQLVRDEVKLEEQAAKARIETIRRPDGTNYTLGVINLPAFYVDLKSKFKDREEFRSSARDVAQLIVEMRATNRIDGILLDLRNNGGGSLTEAVEMTGLFLRSGPVVQVNEMRSVQILNDQDPSILYAGPLAVLVSRQSASAAEILSAALQDYGRAVIIGDSKTHGKGSVQTLVNLDSNNARLGQLKITTATFHRIAGGSTQREGVRADVVVPSFLDVMEVGEEFLPNALPWSQVLPAYYRPVMDTAPIIPVLREKSALRQSQDPRFKSNRAMLARFAEQQNSQAITLNLTRRLALARAEKDIAGVEDKLEDPDAADDDGRGDVVLPEALQILADYINFTRMERKP